MVEPENVYVSIAYFVAWIVCQARFHAIITYHENKPLGLQSLLGQVIVLFVRVSQGTMTFAALVFSIVELNGPMDSNLASAIALVEYLFTLVFYSSLLMMTLTKYFSIYNSSFISELNEMIVMKYLKGFLIVFPLIIAPIELSFWTKLEDTEAYQLFHTGNTGSASTLGYGKIIMVLLNFAAAILLQVRLEIDLYNQPNHDNLGWLAKIKSFFPTRKLGVEVEGYELSIFRLIVTLILSMMGVFLAEVMFQAVTFRHIVLFFYILMGDVFPLIFIINHPNMRTHLFKMLHHVIGGKIGNPPN